MKKKRHYKPSQNHIWVLMLLPKIGEGKGKYKGKKRGQILRELKPQLDAQQTLSDLLAGRKEVEAKQLNQLTGWLKILAKHKFAAHNRQKQWHQLRAGHDFLLRTHTIS